MEQSDIQDLLRPHGIHPERIDVIPAKPSNNVYRINDRLLLRCADFPMDNEIERIRRADAISKAPRLKHVGSYSAANGIVYYAIMDFLEGVDLIEACSALTQDQQHTLGRLVADFLGELHSVEGPAYDIGHYVPAIPHYDGSWQRGHEEYCSTLRKDISTVEMGPRCTEIIAESFAFIDSSIGCLAYQKGARLLHNDFHPKNIIVSGGSFSGVIDWECSQFGEVDFELSHLIHWCLYPPHPSINLRPFLGSLLRHLPYSTDVPDLQTRLTIYQIEHDVVQMVWHGGGFEVDRITRLEGWLDGKVEDLLSSF